ncbi:hypothetical protein BDN67DRAFT_985261 [Paxillus ammoniavirescens]|nr:hypothetical protein BDN67DRAFT_985261 [Paxillus ammoniavirescens]
MVHYSDKSCDNPGHPLPTHLVSAPNASSDDMEDMVKEQVGSGRHPPSPPPFQTPTRLHTTVKATSHNSGIMRDAQVCCERLLAQVVPDIPSIPEQESNPFCSDPIPRCASNPTSQNEVQCASLLFSGPQGADIQNSTSNNEGSAETVPAQGPSVEELTLSDRSQTQTQGALSDSDTPHPHPQQHSTLEIKASRIEHEVTLDMQTFSSLADDIDMDGFDHPDSPLPPSVRGKSPQPPACLSHETQNKKVNSGDQPQQSFTLGRTTSTVTSILDEGFEIIHNQFTELAEKMSWCYKAFQQEFPDAWQEILATYEEAEVLGGMDKTVAQHQQLFHKSTRKLAQLFFTERCRADENKIIAHFKAHIYNRTSLANIAHMFEDNDQPEGPSAKKEDDNDIPETVDPEECEDHALVRSKFIQALEKVGCKWASGKLFPWKNLPLKLAKSEIVCYNYPHGASFPGEERQPRPKGGSKGISDLTLGECSILVTALSYTGMNGLHFKHIRESKARLLASTIPVIHSAAPDHDSLQLCGLPSKSNVAATCIKKPTRQPSCDIETISILDSDGVPGPPQWKAPHAPPSIHDSDGIEEVSSPSVEKPRPTHVWKKPEVVITCARKSLKKIAVDSESSDLSSASGSEYQPGEGDMGVGQGSKPDKSPTGETGALEYEQLVPSSQKHKVIADTSSCVLKKRAAALPSAIEVQPSKGKAKAKAQSTDSKRIGHRAPSRSSVGSSEDEVTLDSATGQPQANPLQTVSPTPQDIHKPHAPDPSHKSTPQEHAPDTTAPSLPVGHPRAEASDDVAPVVEEQESDTCRISTAPLPGHAILIGGHPSVPSQHRPLPMVPLATSMELPTRANTILNSNPQPMRPKLMLAKKKIPDTNQDPDDIFSLCKQLQPPRKNETVPLSTLSANLVAAEEGRAHTSIDMSHPWRRFQLNKTHHLQYLPMVLPSHNKNLLPCSLTTTIMLDTNPQQCTMGAILTCTSTHHHGGIPQALVLLLWGCKVTCTTSSKTGMVV